MLARTSLALVVALAGVAPAHAFLGCSRPRAPILLGSSPSSYGSDGLEMGAYARDMQDYLECLRAEHEDAAAELRRQVDGWSLSTRRTPRIGP